MPLADPKETTIINALETRLKLIAAGATYHTNLGTNISVWRPRTKAFESAEIPACNIRDVRARKTKETQGGSENEWYHLKTVELDIVCDTIDQYRKAKMDVFTAIAQDELFTNTIIDIDFDNDEIVTDQEEQKFLGGTVQLFIHYRTNRLEN